MPIYPLRKKYGRRFLREVWIKFRLRRGIPTKNDENTVFCIFIQHMQPYAYRIFHKIQSLWMIFPRSYPHSVENPKRGGFGVFLDVTNCFWKQMIELSPNCAILVDNSICAACGYGKIALCTAWTGKDRRRKTRVYLFDENVLN